MSVYSRSGSALTGGNPGQIYTPDGMGGYTWQDTQPPMQQAVPSRPSTLVFNPVTGKYEPMELEGFMAVMSGTYLIPSSSTNWRTVTNWAFGQSYSFDFGNNILPDANGIVTIPETGIYLISASLRFSAFSSTEISFTHVAAAIFMSGSAGKIFLLGEHDQRNDGRILQTHASAVSIKLIAGDQIDIRYYFQTSTFGDFIVVSPRILSQSHFSCYRLPGA